MIIKNGSKHPITISDYPNKNWTNDKSYFVVDDNSELGKKIIQHTPYYEEVRNSSGKLIDITPTERPTEPETTRQPTLEERVSATEEAINLLLGL